MPIIRIDFDNDLVSREEILALSEATQKIVSEVTEIEDVSAYANSPDIKVKIAPIEVFVQMSAHKIKNVDELVAKIKLRLSTWKQEQHFSHPINFTFIPMEWKIEIGI
jgi:hypothetical protein